MNEDQSASVGEDEVVAKGLVFLFHGTIVVSFGIDKMIVGVSKNEKKEY